MYAISKISETKKKKLKKKSLKLFLSEQERKEHVLRHSVKDETILFKLFIY